MEFFNKIGNAFANFGSGNSLYGDQQQMNLLRNSANPEDMQKLQQFKRQGFQNLADVMGVIGAQGDPQRMALAQNKIRQRKIDEENARLKAEQEAEKDAFIKANPQYAKMIKMNELFDFNPPAAKQRQSFVAKDGYRYFVDGNNERVFPGVTVKETQTEADIYKENAARIKNIVMKESIDSPKLTKQERDFYNNNINKQGFMSFDESLAQMMFGNTGEQNNQTKNYTVTNSAYGSMTANQIIDQAMQLNPGSTREGVIKNLINNKIISE